MAELPQQPYTPYTITINNQAANKALEVLREAIDVLYQPTGKVITRGRDLSTRLLERIIDQFIENYYELGGDHAPRNNAIMRFGYGYGQRFAPINFMQAFVQGIFTIVEYKEKLIRSFEYCNWKGHFILPHESNSLFRLGYEHWAARGTIMRVQPGSPRESKRVKTFFQSKTAALPPTYHATTEKALRNTIV